jgi:DNA repair exonuclease SbcCD nuclease subunit
VALFAGEQARLEPDPAVKYNLLMLHGTIGGAAAEQKLRYVSEYGGAIVENTDIGPERWNYVALGHYHIATEMAPNMWYAGGIERTSTNIWMEKEDKGFLLYDTETRRADFQPLRTRTVVDLPWVEARGLGPAEVDARIRALVEKVPEGIKGKIVRMVVTDVQRPCIRELNHKQIREWKAEALHFHLDARPPQVRRRIASGAPVRRLTLREQVESWMDRWTPTREGVTKEKLKEMGGEYVERAAEGV